MLYHGANKICEAYIKYGIKSRNASEISIALQVPLKYSDISWATGMSVDHIRYRFILNVHYFLTSLENERQLTALSKSPIPITWRVFRFMVSHILTWGCSYRKRVTECQNQSTDDHKSCMLMLQINSDCGSNQSTLRV